MVYISGHHKTVVTNENIKHEVIVAAKRCVKGKQDRRQGGRVNHHKSKTILETNCKIFLNFFCIIVF